MPLVRELTAIGHLRLTGADRVRFLQGMLTNDVARLGPGQGCHAAMLTIKGRILADLRVFMNATACHLELDAPWAEKLRQEIDRHLFADDVTVEDKSAESAAVVVYGEGGAALLADLLPGGSSQGEGQGLTLVATLEGLAPYQFINAEDLRVSADPELLQPGWRVVGARPAVVALGERLRAAGAAVLDEAGYEVLRIEAGRPRYGIDMSEERMPPEARLDDAISYNKGCYAGQEVIVRLRDQGHLNWKLMGLRLSGQTPVPPRTRLSAPERAEAGEITSSVVSPRLGPIALGYVHRSQYTPGTVLTVQDPSGERTATVVDLPFGKDA
jgi:folate-binding protein YgfZ